jgi:ketosteroid isomerase-like protein
VRPSAELQGVIRSWFEAVSRGDPSWLERHLSRDGGLRVIGTDPQEWLQGRTAAELLEGDLAVLGGKATVRVEEVEAYSEGCARPAITREDGRTVSPRWSAVFRREAGDWRAVQIHASVGVANEQLFGAEFPSQDTVA